MDNTQKIGTLKERKAELDREVRDLEHRQVNMSKAIQNFAVSGWLTGEAESHEWALEVCKETLRLKRAESATLKAEIEHLERGKTAGKKFGF